MEKTHEEKNSFSSYAGWALLILPVTLFVLAFLVPLLINTFISFTHWGRFGQLNFAGLDSYRKILTDLNFWKLAINSFFPFSPPVLFLRDFIIIVAPLALALLLVELPQGGRVTIKILLAPLILFSSPLITESIYWGAGLITPPHNILYHNYPLLAMHGLLFGTTLLVSMTLGTPLFLGLMRRARSSSLDPNTAYRNFWSQAWRLLLIFGVCVMGFSVANLENAYFLKIPLICSYNLMRMTYERFFMHLDFSAAAATFSLLMLRLIFFGLIFLIFLELSDISIRFTPRVKEKMTTGCRFSVRRFCLVTGIIITILVLGIIGCGLFFPIIKGRTYLFITRSIPSDSITALWNSIRRSLGVAGIQSLFSLIIAMLAGFVLGYVKPRGSKFVLITLGAFIFISPAFLIFPLYLFFNKLGLINNMVSIVIPGLLSPLGIIVYTWFFRGLRNEQSQLEAKNSYCIDLDALHRRILGSLALFSLPVLMVLMLSSLSGGTFLQLGMISQKESFLYPLYLQIRSAPTLSELSGPISLTEINSLAVYYLIPLVLFILSIVFVFPRLAIIFGEKKSPNLAPEILNKINRGEGLNHHKPEQVSTVPLNKPAGLKGLSILPLLLLGASLTAFALVSQYPPTPRSQAISLLLTPAIFGLLLGGVLYLVNVYHIHKALSAATEMNFPISPLKAVIFHFVPVFNILWVYNWVKETSAFINRQNPKRFLIPGLFLFFFYLTGIVSVLSFYILPEVFAVIQPPIEGFRFSVSLFGLILSFTSMSTLLGVTIYLADELKKLKTEKFTTLDNKFSTNT